MSEARANMIRDLVDKVTKHHVDEGRLIEAGWQALKLMTIPKTASEWQINDMRMAYFAGAQHLFASIMSLLEPGMEATDKDLERFDLIHKELQEFYFQMKEKQDGHRRN